MVPLLCIEVVKSSSIKNIFYWSCKNFYRAGEEEEGNAYWKTNAGKIKSIYLFSSQGLTKKLLAYKVSSVFLLLFSFSCFTNNKLSFFPSSSPEFLQSLEYLKLHWPTQKKFLKKSFYFLETRMMTLFPPVFAPFHNKACSYIG